MPGMKQMEPQQHNEDDKEFDDDMMASDDLCETSGNNMDFYNPSLDKRQDMSSRQHVICSISNH